MKHNELKPGQRVTWKKEGTFGSYGATVVRIGNNRITILVDSWEGEPRDPHQVTVTARGLRLAEENC
jgi:hypothetical protein